MAIHVLKPLQVDFQKSQHQAIRDGLCWEERWEQVFRGHPFNFSPLYLHTYYTLMYVIHSPSYSKAGEVTLTSMQKFTAGAYVSK